MEAIRNYEAMLCSRVLAGLACMDKIVVYGMQNSGSVHMRVPTICFNVQGVPPAQVATTLAERGIGVRDGNMYSPRLLKRLSIPPEPGAVRASLVHYNSSEEVDRFLAVIHDMVPAQ
jgi:selenocysteine lyase/cysteine desulfurase